MLGVLVGVGVIVGVRVAVRVGVAVVVGVAVRVGVEVRVEVRVGVAVNVWVALGVAVKVRVLVGVCVGVGVEVSVGVGVAQSLSFPKLQPEGQHPSFPVHVMIGEQADGSPAHAKQVSVWQVVLQPSPAMLAPSSHCSPRSKRPLPHAGSKALVELGGPAGTSPSRYWMR